MPGLLNTPGVPPEAGTRRRPNRPAKNTMAPFVDQSPPPNRATAQMETKTLAQENGLRYEKNRE